MYKIKYAISKQPLILVLFLILVAVSIGEYFNAHSVRKSADANYAMVIESVAKLENISEKKDALEIEDYDILCAGEKLELSPESQMIVSSFVNHHSKTAASMTTILTMGFDVIVLTFFIVLCDWIYQEDYIACQRLEIAAWKLSTRIATDMGNEAAAMARELADRLKTLLDSSPDSNSDPESNSEPESDTAPASEK